MSECIFASLLNDYIKQNRPLANGTNFKTTKVKDFDEEDILGLCRLQTAMHPKC